MKRTFVLSALCLALAGCAQSKGALSRGASYPPSPVAITPVPSVYDTINPGLGGKAVAQSAIKDPDDLRWAGRAPVLTAAQPPAPGVPPGQAVAAAITRGAGSTATAAAGSPPAAGRPMGASPAIVSAAAPAAFAPLASAGPDVAATSPAIAGPATTSSSPATDPPFPSLAAPDLVADPGPQALSSRGAVTGATSPPPASASPMTPPAVISAANVAGRPPASMPSSIVQTAGSNYPVARRTSDPLLGPDPDLMPSMPDGPPIKTTAVQEPPPAGPPPLEATPSPNTAATQPLEATPSAITAAAQPLEATPSANTAATQPPSAAQPASAAVVPAVIATPMPIDPPIELEKSSPDGPPANASAPPEAAPGVTGTTPTPIVPPVELEKLGTPNVPVSAETGELDLPIESAPPAGPESPSTSAITPSAARRHVDPQVILTSSQSPKDGSNSRKRIGQGSGSPVARVGDEIITFHDLVTATKEALSKYPQPQGNAFDSEQAMQARQHSDMVAREVLKSLIDRSLLVQEAKRHIKDKKMLERAYETADKIWHDEEVVPLERRYTVDSEPKLKEKLAEDGRSLDAMRQNFRQYFLAQSYLHEKLKDRLGVELPDLLKYYNERVYQHDYDRPAQITWREIVVEIDKHKSREEAQAKANLLLEKVRRGEDFAKLALTESEGPTSSRTQGGLMRTTPGSYAVKPINDALDSLPLGQVSGVLEGPDSFHILKVEKRRPAGPASFEEVQDQIKPLLVAKKFQEERDAFLEKIKRNALVKIYGPDGNDIARPTN